MRKINNEFIQNISDTELLRFYGEELISLFDCEKYDLSKEQLKVQVKAVISNFIEQLIECITPKNP